MSILEFQGLAQSFGDFDLFSGLAGSIPADARIGLVGPNGVGKTTLLRFLADRASPSAGNIDRSRGLRIGYLPQEAVQAFADRHHDVYREMLAVFKDLRADEQRLRALERQISDGADDEETLERYGRLQAAFELAGGYEYEQRIRRVLTGLGFPEGSWEQSLDELSGGQKTRILLARLLLEAPDLLIMDEPTNHLDVETIAWLEGMLTATEGALLVVSHDRYFLDRVANVIWEMSPTRIERYRGNYSAYVLQRRERWALRAKAYEDMMARFEKELDFVRRNIAGQRGQMAKGKLSRLGREVEAVHAGGLEMIDIIRSKGWLQATAEFDLVRPSDKPNEVGRRIGELRPPVAAMPEIKLELATIARGGDFVLRSKDLVVGYDGVPLLEVDDLELMRGERVALIGGNGTGKTTLLKTLLNELPAVSGSLKPGAGLEVGYFAQAHDSFDPDASVLDTLMQETGLKVAEARSYLAKFLFKSDEVFNKVGALSGGERGRLALAILARRNANFLLLDEPTNHLDIQAQEILENVLINYQGTLLMVSHDRYLVRRLATQIWAVEDGRLKVHPWGYDEYLETQRLGAEEAALRRSAAAKRSSDKPEPATPKLSKNEVQRRRAEAEQIELQIAEQEEQMGDLEVSLQNASENGDYEAMHRLGKEHAEVKERIEALYLRWDVISDEIASAEVGGG